MDALEQTEQLIERLSDFCTAGQAAGWDLAWQYLKNDIEEYASSVFVEGEKDYVTIWNAVDPQWTRGDEWPYPMTDVAIPTLKALKLVEHRLREGHARLKDAEQEEILILANTPHSAYVVLRELVQGATNELFLVDPYMDSSIFALLSNLKSTVGGVRLLTRKSTLPKDFATELAHFTQQYGIAVEVRVGLTDLHDRFLLVDNQVFLSGASFKDLGKKSSTVVEVKDAAQAIKALVTASWNLAQPI